MAIQIQGNSGNVAEVDGSTFRAIRTVARPVDHSVYGFYQASMTSGVLAAALAANAVLFSFRWSDATRLAVLYYLKVSFQPLTLFTAASLADFGFDGYFGRSFSANHTGGTAATLTGNSFKARTSMGTTLLADMRISSTAALAGGTVTVDGNAFIASIGDQQWVNPAAATEEQNVNDPTLEYKPDVASGEHPLVFAQNEGFVVRNRGVWPAAGTGIIQVTSRWAEVASY